MNNTLLSNVDRIVSGLGPVANIVDIVASKILPETKAQAWACIYGSFCFTSCSGGTLFIIWRESVVNTCTCWKYAGAC